MRRLWILLAVVLLSATSITCSPVYVIRAGIEEAKILSRRQPIERVAADPATPEEVRRKLALVLEARGFAERMLGLDVGESYTTYSWIERDTLALVLSAAHRDRFREVTWWFPIVGRVPYKGYFSLEAAQRAARRLEEQGYDTYIRPTSAFSTLGWFNDPLLSTLLRYDDVSLVSTVIHELTHNTLYLPSQVSFNESFASFVGDRGAIAFFCALEGEEGPRCAEAKRHWSDNLVFGKFLEEVIAELEGAYARSDLSPERRIALREEVFAREVERFQREVQPRLSAGGYRGVGRGSMNNARLIAWRLYYDRLHLFEAVHDRLGRDLRTALHAIKDATTDGADPFAALERLAGETTLPLPAP